MFRSKSCYAKMYKLYLLCNQCWCLLRQSWQRCGSPSPCGCAKQAISGNCVFCVVVVVFGIDIALTRCINICNGSIWSSTSWQSTQRTYLHSTERYTLLTYIFCSSLQNSATLQPKNRHHLHQHHVHSHHHHHLIDTLFFAVCKWCPCLGIHFHLPINTHT